MNLTNVVKFLNEQQIKLELNGQVIEVSSIVGDPNSRKISIVGRYPLSIYSSVTRDPNEVLPCRDGIDPGIMEILKTYKQNSDIPIYHTDVIKLQKDPIHINELPHEQEKNILGMGEYISDHMPDTTAESERID